MKINSDKVSVTADAAAIKTFLMDMNNVEHLLPQDKVKDFKGSVEQCSFKVQGGVTISLIQNGSKETEEVYMKSGEGSPFPFTLTVHLKQMRENTEGYIHFNGEVNMFLKMMVEKPLTALFNYMSQKLKDHFEA
jgi:carbon monoxide dehydrogenase subunit G